MPRRESRTHAIRTNRADGVGRRILSPYTRQTAISIHCTECMGYESDPKVCTSSACALYPFRKKTHMAYEKNMPKALPQPQNGEEGRRVSGP